jgi:RND family efflux transporter MFP subunit
MTERFSMKRKFTYAGAAGLALIAAAGGAFVYGGHVGALDDADAAETAAAPEGPPPAPVALAKAQARSLAPRADTPGAVVSVRDSRVASAASGKIEWVAEVGAEVEAGDVIARLEQDDAKFARDDNAAQVDRLRARAVYLKSYYERFASLGAEAGESEASLDEMRANRDEAQHALRQAETSLDRAEKNLERTVVRAPFAGRVVSQESQIGEFANPGTELVRLVDTKHLEVTARAPAGLTRNIAPGETIKVANGAESLDATVRAVVPVGEERSRMLEIRLELPETNWYIGSAVRVSLPSERPRMATAVPRDALVLRADRVSIYKIAENNVAKRVDVELGAAEGDYIEVIGEIAPGDDVVIRGGERLRAGQLVTLATTPVEPSA